MTITNLKSSTQLISKTLPIKQTEQKNLEAEKDQVLVKLPPTPQPQKERQLVGEKFTNYMLPENREAYKKLTIELNEKCFFSGATLQDSIDNWELSLAYDVFTNLGEEKVLTEDDFKHIEKESARFKEHAAQVSNIENYKPTFSTNGSPILNAQDLSSYYKKSSNSSSPTVSSQLFTKVEEFTPKKSSIYNAASAKIINSYKKHQSQVLSLSKKWKV